jgi:hypothetical protein
MNGKHKLILFAANDHTTSSLLTGRRYNRACPKLIETYEKKLFSSENPVAEVI